MRRSQRIMIYTAAVSLGLALLVGTLFVFSGRLERVFLRERLNQTAKKTRNLIADHSFLDDEMDGIDEKQQLERLMKSAEKDNNDRLVNVDKACMKYGLGIYRNKEKSRIVNPTTPKYDAFFIDEDNELAICPIHKAGASTWLYNLCLLAGLPANELRKAGPRLRKVARDIYPLLRDKDTEKVLETAIKIMTVRHPFERLLAVYRDKLENKNMALYPQDLYYYRTYARQIVDKYREGGNTTLIWELISPSECIRNPDEPKPVGTEPTFKEFVRYLIDMELNTSTDEHWAPYYLLCSPCLLRYNFITKVETLARDQLYTIRILGLDDIISPVWHRKTQYLSEFLPGPIVSPAAKAYFQQLTIEEITKLYKKYKIDFELFGYNHDVYYQYALDYRPVKIKRRKII